MTLVKHMKVGGVTVGRVNLNPVTINKHISALASVGGIRAWFSPSATLEAASPLTLRDLTSTKRKFISETSGASPTLGTRGGKDVFIFDGANDTAKVIDVNGDSDSDVVPVGGDDYTIIAAIYPDTLPASAPPATQSVVLGSVSGGGEETRLQLNSNGRVSAHHGTRSIASTATSQVSAGQFCTVAMSYDSATDTLAAFHNGVKGPTVVTNPIDLTQATFRVGNYAAASTWYDGGIGDTMVLNWSLHGADNTAKASFLIASFNQMYGIT